MRERGLRCTGIDPDDDFTVQLPATDDPAELGVQDIVFVGLKAHSAAEAADTMTPLLGPDTAVVPAVNGFPWWVLPPVR